MSEIKDYSNWSKEELLAEQKKFKTKQTSSAVLIGVFVGILLYGFFANGFGWVYISISVFMIYVINKNSAPYKDILAKIKSEIENKTV